MEFLEDTPDPLFVGCFVEVKINPTGDWIRARSPVPMVFSLCITRDRIDTHCIGLHVWHRTDKTGMCFERVADILPRSKAAQARLELSCTKEKKSRRPSFSTRGKSMQSGAA